MGLKNYEMQGVIGCLILLNNSRPERVKQIDFSKSFYCNEAFLHFYIHFFILSWASLYILHFRCFMDKSSYIVHLEFLQKVTPMALYSEVTDEYFLTYFYRT